LQGSGEGGKRRSAGAIQAGFWCLVVYLSGNPRYSATPKNAEHHGRYLMHAYPGAS
jgi:hypothetical protein